MTTPTHPLRTAEEMLEAIESIINSPCPRCSGNTFDCAHDEYRLDAIRSRIAPPDPRHEGLREAVEKVTHYAGCGDHSCLFVKPNGMGTNGGCRCIERARPGLAFSLGGLYKAALAALEPAAPQPTKLTLDQAREHALRISHEAEERLSADRLGEHGRMMALPDEVPQPTADDVVRAVRDALGHYHASLVERAIHACFDAARAEGSKP